MLFYPMIKYYNLLLISVKIIQCNFSVKYPTVLFVEISRDKNKALREWGLKFIITYVMTYKYEIFSSTIFLHIIFFLEKKSKSLWFALSLDVNVYISVLYIWPLITSRILQKLEIKKIFFTNWLKLSIICRIFEKLF